MLTDAWRSVEFAQGRIAKRGNWVLATLHDFRLFHHEQIKKFCLVQFKL